MRSRYGRKVIALLALTLLVGSVVATPFALQAFPPLDTMSLPPTPVVSPVAEALFRAEIGPMDDINGGLELRRVDTGMVQGVPTPSPNYISLLILNHTSEPMTFSDIGFHIRAFFYEAGSQTWVAVEFVYSPERKETILPAKLETFELDALNSWEIFPTDLPPGTPAAIRLMVSGIGIQTRRSYAAYLDVALER